MEDKIRHLEMIQGVISRMASNSFMLKGWAVTLVAGIFALASDDADQRYFIVAYVPIIVFWGLDAYYLLQERLYRSLYNRVTSLEIDEINFSMKATRKDFPDKKNCFCSTVMSVTELCFYLPLALICAFVIWATAI